MRRYYFRLDECGSVTEDREGLELPDDGTAHLFAVRNVRDYIASEVKDGRLCLGCHISIRDENGNEVMRVNFRDVLAVSGI